MTFYQYSNKPNGIWHAREGSVFATGKTQEEAAANLNALLAKPRIELDWKIMLFKVLDGVGDAEGVWFESSWPVTDEERLEILRSYDDHQKGLEQECGDTSS